MENAQTFTLRNKLRYGVFSATCDRDVGKCTVKVSISGFGDLIEIYKGDRFVTSVDTIEDESDFWQESETTYYINGYSVTLGRCLKRFR